MKYPNRNCGSPVMSAKRIRRMRWLSIAVGLILIGCAAVGPDYTPIKPDGPETWNAEMAGGLTPNSPDPGTLASWWTIFNDPELTRLEQRAVDGNLELDTARSRIREARALRGVSQARLFPTVGAQAASKPAV